MLAFYNQI